MGIVFLIVLAIGLAVYAIQVRKKNEQKSQPMHFDLLDDDGNPIKEDAPISATSQSKVKVVIGGGDSDAPVQELKYFCIKDKGYHTSVWPHGHNSTDVVEFSIAGVTHSIGITDYLGEFKGTLAAEPDNPYDHNAIEVLAPDGHHVGYVPKNMTSTIRRYTTLPCPCYCYIGINGSTLFSDCYIII